MKAKWSTAFAAVLSAGAVCTSRALTQVFAEAPATLAGKATCESRYLGSFLDIGRGDCWECPSSHPNRTVFPVTDAKACERPAGERFRSASGPVNPTGLIGTDCPSGYFLDIGRGKCYSCSGYQRTAYPIDHARACSQAVAVSWTGATSNGPPGCSAGSFRHGLTDRCYSCPVDYVRNAVIADDLTKVNACTQITQSQREATKARFDREKNNYPESRANLARAAVPRSGPGGPPDAPPEVKPPGDGTCTLENPACAVNSDTTVRTSWDISRHKQMVIMLEDELKHERGLGIPPKPIIVIGWVNSVTGAALLGYTHAEGFAMTKVDNGYVCRKIWSNAFGAVALGVAIVEEISLSTAPLDEGKSETNGFTLGIAGILTASFGLHWDASGNTTMAWSVGPAPAIEIIAEYAHTWEETGKEVDCNKMTWSGDRWKDL